MQCALIKDKHLGHQIGRVSRNFQAFFINELKAYNLSFEQGVVLLYIEEDSQIYINHIAKELDKNKATISREIQRLIAKGFASKKLAQNDKRTYIFTLTPKGKNASLLLRAKLMQLEALIHEICTQQEIDTCLDVLTRIRLMLEDALLKQSQLA